MVCAQSSSSTNDPQPESDKIKFILDCHIAEYNSIRSEITIFERRLYTLSAAYLAFFGTIFGIITKFWNLETIDQNFIGSLLLLLTFINSLYNIIASSISWSILRLGLYIRDWLCPKVNRLLGFTAGAKGSIWEWEYLLRNSSRHIGSNYRQPASFILQHGETLFGAIIYLPSILISPVLLYYLAPFAIKTNNKWLLAGFTFCLVLLLFSLTFGIIVALAYIKTERRITQ